MLLCGPEDSDIPVWSMFSRIPQLGTCSARRSPALPLLSLLIHPKSPLLHTTELLVGP